MDEDAIWDLIPDGRLTDPDAYVDMDMRGIMRYCKEKNISTEELTDGELARFIRPPKPREATR